ncbi:MAG: DUF6629 family protein [Acidobacteriaceae bacterium]
MCFSATANFAGSAVIGAVGVATLKEVRHRRAFLFGAIPLLFALHQFIEGFVWLGLDGILSPATAHDMGAAFVLYAQGLLPFVLPLSVYMIEPTPHRRKRMLPFVLLGGGLALYILWGLTAFPLSVYVRGHSIVYDNPATTTTPVAILYVIATCGALFFSGFRYLIIFGWANLIGLTVVAIVMSYAFTSIWCAYAAAISVIVYFHFRRRRHMPAVLYPMRA